MIAAEPLSDVPRETAKPRPEPPPPDGRRLLGGLPRLPQPTEEGLRVTRIVVGVDNLRAHKPVVGLIERLGFPNPQVALVHAATETLP